jgi:hypothetical protein
MLQMWLETEAEAGIALLLAPPSPLSFLHKALRGRELHLER